MAGGGIPHGIPARRLPTFPPRSRFFLIRCGLRSAVVFGFSLLLMAYGGLKRNQALFSLFLFLFSFLSLCVSLDFLSVHQAVDVLARQFLLLAHLSRPDAHEKILIVINLKWRCVRSCFLSKFLLCSELFLSSLINNNWSQRFSECMPR